MTARDPLSEQCTATSKRTGRRCQRRVIGGGVCRMHGGAAQAATQNRLARVELGRSLSSAPRRHPADVLLAALHACDWLAQQSMTVVGADERVSAERTRELIDAVERAARLAKMSLDANVSHETSAAVRETEAARLVEVLDLCLRSILSDLALSPSQERLASYVVPGRLRELADREAGRPSSYVPPSRRPTSLAPGEVAVLR